ncbi:hypothetical protein ACHEXK_13075 [Limnohabitans sp. DCL3]|uniref:hypothetical protein n=1 Tax=Limnohabitans sp. DCL3 TaxID=3374103 RepID=UPI003A878607
MMNLMWVKKFSGFYELPRCSSNRPKTLLENGQMAFFADLGGASLGEMMNLTRGLHFSSLRAQLADLVSRENTEKLGPISSGIVRGWTSQRAGIKKG